MFAQNQEEPKPVSIAGLPLVCPHCKNERFYERRWLLNTTGMTFMNLDWLNESAMNYLCANCGRIEWFSKTVAGDDAFPTTKVESEW
ncbi:MAG: DNA-binding protein [Verrucomicrobiaceae bacterium]|nr:MAG: DNA-binding protein [Verrucomicrobiaceae bacterium]